MRVCPVRRLHPLIELILCQPPGREVLAQRLRDRLALLVRDANVRLYAP
jgi:hypothetical protein